MPHNGESEPSPEKSNLNHPPEGGDVNVPSNIPLTPRSDGDKANFGDTDDEDPRDEILDALLEASDAELLAWLKAHPDAHIPPLPRRPDHDQATTDTPQVSSGTLGFNAPGSVLEGPIRPEDAEAIVPHDPALEDVMKFVGDVDDGMDTDKLEKKFADPFDPRSVETTVELPILLPAQHRLLWEDGHGQVKEFSSADMPVAVLVLQHRETVDTGNTPLQVNGYGMSFDIGSNDIVKVFYRDADGQLDLNNTDVFQGATNIPEGFTVADASPEVESMAPDHPLLAAVSKAISRRRKADAAVYVSKTDPDHWFTVVYPGKKNEEKVRLVAPDGTLVIAGRTAIVKEFSVPDKEFSESEFEPDKPIELNRTTAQALAEGQDRRWFAL